MAGNYESVTVREITDVEPESGELLDYVEAHAKTIPSGISIMVRVPAKGATAGDVDGLLAAKASEYEKMAGL